MKGFVSSLVLLLCITFILNTFYISEKINTEKNEIKNIVLLNQRISDREYEMQHDFESAIRDGKLLLVNDENDEENSAILCMSLLPLKIKYNLKAGCIADDYEIDFIKTNLIILKDSVKEALTGNELRFFEENINFAEPCMKFLRYENRNAIVGLNTKLDFENNLVYCNSGFLMESEVAGNEVKMIIPMERII